MKLKDKCDMMINKKKRQNHETELGQSKTHTHTHTHTPVSYTHLDVYKRQC